MGKAGTRAFSVKTWVFMAFMVSFLGVVLPVFSVLFWTTDQEFRSYVYGEDREKARIYGRFMEKFPGSSWAESVAALKEAYPDSRSEHLVILGASGRVEWDTTGKLFQSDHPPEHLADAVPLFWGGRVGGFLLVGTMVDPALTHNHSAYITRLVWTLLALLAGALVLGAAAAQALSLIISKPMVTLALAAQSTGDFQPGSSPVTTPREVQVLGESLHRMAISLEESERRKARILADAAHELRTPLTVMRGTLEALVEGVFPPTPEILSPLYQETLRLQNIVETIRSLEELHRTRQVRKKVNLPAFLQEVAGFFQIQSRETGTQILVSGSQTLTLETEPEILKQVLFNLISNAFKYGKARGTIQLNYHQVPGALEVVVEDDGPGIPPEERDKIFERFYRLDPSRSGDNGGRGLGLSIVRELTSRLGGSVRAEAGSTGGARFVVKLETGFPAPA